MGNAATARAAGVVIRPHPERTAALLKSDIDQYARIIKIAHIELER